jgi:outer membrane receptor protein involved in Fe transport
LYAQYTHPSGFFGQVESVYYSQSNSGYEPDLPGDSFWQFNAYVGYRFARRHAEVRVGVLNITDQDYNLNPLNLTAELPRERNLAISFRFNF